MTKNNIITAILLLLIVAGVAGHIQQDKQREGRLIEQTNDLQYQLQQTRSELQRQAGYRDSLTRLSDSLLLRVGGLTVAMKRKDKEIASIKGRYEFVPVDSLRNLMEERARWKRGN